MSLHIHNRGGFKSVGAAVALDGSEDHLVTREAKQVWDEVGMAAARETALCDVGVEVAAGRLQWTYEQVYDLAMEFPRRGVLDRVEDLQDDEAAGCDDAPWREDGESAVEGGEADEGGDDEVSEQGDDAAASAVAETAPSPGEAGASAVAETAPSSGKAGAPAVAELSPDLGDAAEVHNRRMAALHRLKALAGEAESPHIALTIAWAIQVQLSRLRGLSRTNCAVALAVLRRQGEDALAERAQQAEFAAYRDAARKRSALASQLDDATGAVKKARQDLDALRAVRGCQSALKSYSPESLGQGNARGGTATHVKNRMGVLDRVARQCGVLSPEQSNDWKWFKEAWDRSRAADRGAEWGTVFAEAMQGLLEDTRKGIANAIFLFMHRETDDFLKTIALLSV